jgi:hypothetical protein
MNRRGLMKRPLFIIIVCVFAAALVVGVAYFVWHNKSNVVFTDSIGDNIVTIELDDQRASASGSVIINKKADINRLYGLLKGIRLKEIPFVPDKMPVGFIEGMVITTKDGKKYGGSFLGTRIYFNSKMYEVESDYFDGLKDRYDESFKKYPVTPLVSDKP